MSNILPDCMAPDGAEPCRGYTQLRTALEAAQAKVEKLKRRCAALLTAKEMAVANWKAALSAERAQRERVEEALRESPYLKYARHLPKCSRLRSDTACECGLNNLRAALARERSSDG